MRRPIVVNDRHNAGYMVTGASVCEAGGYHRIEEWLGANGGNLRVKDSGLPGFPAGGGEMAALIRAHDWAATPIGPIETWPQPLRTAVGIMLGAVSPMGLYWGLELVLLYNDAWRELIADKHPGALGRPAREVFPEIWDEIGPIFAGVLDGRGAADVVDGCLPLDRHGRIENAWFSFSFNPIPLEDGSVGGILNIGAETTERVLAERAGATTEAALRESEGQFRLLADANLIGVGFGDSEGKVFYVNDEMLRMMGHSRADFEAGRIDWSARIAPEDRENLAHTQQVLQRDGAVTGYERSFLRPDGGRTRFIGAAALVRSEKDLHVSLALDVTHMREAEAALRESEARLSTIMGHAPIGIGLFDQTGRLLFTNRMLAELRDTLIPSRDPERQRHWQAFDQTGKPVPPAEWPGARALRGEVAVPGLDFLTDALGEARWLRIAAAPVPGEGEVEHAIIIVEDVTDRRRALQRQRESEARLRLAQEVAGVGTFEWNIQTNVNRWSPEIERLYGLPKGGFGGTYEEWALRVHPDDLPEAERRVQAALESGQFDAEWRVVRPNGEVAWLLARGIVEKDAQGNPLRMVGANVDITERKLAEERQTMLMAELDHRVKNVLTVVQSIAMQSLRSTDRHAAERFTGRVAALARAHGLLAASRWEGAALRHVLDETLAPYDREGAGRVTIEGPDLRLTPKAAQSLTLVFHELTTNAVKYGALSTSAGRLAVTWDVNGDGGDRRMVLTWRESGGPTVQESPRRPGFGSKLIERTLSYELQGSAALDYRPTGLVATLDLSLAGVAGAIPPAGVPTAAGAVRTTRPRTAQPERLAGKRILIVEDQNVIAEQVARILREAGCAVAGPAATLEHAVRLAEQEPLDAAVLDINLDGAMVWPVTEVLGARGVPFLFAIGDAETLRPPPGVQDTPRIEKPIEAAHLRAALADLL